MLRNRRGEKKKVEKLFIPSICRNEDVFRYLFPKLKEEPRSKNALRKQEGWNFHFILHYRFCWTVETTYTFSNATLPRNFFFHIFSIAQRTFKFPLRKMRFFIFFLSLFSVVYFSSFFVHEKKQQRISMYAYIYLILKIRRVE
jgi:hypothetical protein